MRVTYNPPKTNKRRNESGVVEVDVPVESSRQPERVVRSSECMGVPAVLELGLLSVGFGAVCVGLAQGFFFRVQKSRSLLQPEKLENDVREVEPAGSLGQLLRVQSHSFPEKREGNRSRNDVVNAQVIQLFSWKIRKHRENLPAFEFQQSKGRRGVLGMREQPLDDWQNSYKTNESVSSYHSFPNNRLEWTFSPVQNPPQTRNNMRESPINGASPARRPPTLLTSDFLKPALCCNRAPKCKIGITIFNRCERI